MVKNPCNAGDPGSITVSLPAEFHGQEPGRLHFMGSQRFERD